MTLGVIATFFFSSCTKEKTSSNNSTINTNAKGVLTCKLNGNLWQSKTTSLAEMQDSSTLLIGGLNVVGADSQVIILSLELTPQKTGTYTGLFNPINSSTYGLYYPNTKVSNQMNIWFSYTTNYSINLTKFDLMNKLVSGTFSFTSTSPSGSGLPSYVVTEGVFTDVAMQ